MVSVGVTLGFLPACSAWVHPARVARARLVALPRPTCGMDTESLGKCDMALSNAREVGEP